MATFKKESEGYLGQILTHLQKDRRVGKDGAVSYEGLLVENFKTILERYMEVSPEVPEAGKWRMISEALRADGHKRLDLKTILREVSRQETVYKRTVAAHYILATSISLPPDLRIPPVRSHRTTITLRRFLPRNISRKELEVLFRHGSYDPHPKGYSAAIVRLKSRSIAEAVKVALDELDYMRAIWNFVNNLGDFGLPGKLRPINRIRLGQVHTLHDRAGNVVEPLYGDYWIEPNYVYEESSRSITSSWKIIMTNAQKINRRIRRCNYSSDSMRAFIRYGRALDNRDFESVFLKLWSLLEFLTCSRDDYNLLVRRVTFLFEDAALVNQILRHLRERRNDFVHSAVETDRTRTLVFQIKPFVERMMRFHIISGLKFKDREDAVSYLDLPKDPEEIRKKIKHHRMALVFRTPQPSNAPDESPL